MKFRGVEILERIWYIYIIHMGKRICPWEKGYAFSVNEN